jgi:metal-dependent amidase/aminoacylase/carboxypeptidase family protein
VSTKSPSMPISIFITLMLIGQPAEEVFRGAAAMLADGLFTRFPKPDFAISMHDEPSLPSGKVGFHAGLFRASMDSVDVTMYGRGGHGGKPQTTVDPIVLSARAILGIQTIVVPRPASLTARNRGVLQYGYAPLRLKA